MAILLLVLLGAAVGFLLGRNHLRENGYERLLDEAEQEDGPFVDLIDEVTAQLPKLNNSPERLCTSAELVKFQKIAIGSRNLKDAGWIQNGQLICSGVYSRDRLQFSLPAPSLTRADGLKIIHNPFHGRPPFDTNKFRVFMFQMGDAYIVGAPNRYKRPKREPSIEIESTMYDVVSHQLKRPGASPVIHPEAVLDRDSRGSVGNLLYLTVCQPKEQLCTSIFEPFSVEIAKNSGLLLVDTTLGGTLGIILAILGITLNQRRSRLPRRLRRSMQNGGFQLVYQPIVDMASGRIVEAEALLRWKDQQGEPFPPDILVRIAEKHGFMFDLTEQVLRRALLEMGPYLQEDAEFRINVNLAVSDLADERFVPMVDRQLAEAGIAPQSLSFEVTEGSSARKVGVKNVLCQLRARGIGVKIDDFGTGYSSLSYLRELSIDAIKIDKAFTQTIGTDAVTLVILPQILHIARELNLVTIAEGVETEEQAQYYRDNGENILGQGWFYGRPAPASQFLKHWRENHEQCRPVALSAAKG